MGFIISDDLGNKKLCKVGGVCGVSCFLIVGCLFCKEEQVLCQLELCCIPSHKLRKDLDNLWNKKPPEGGLN